MMENTKTRLDIIIARTTISMVPFNTISPARHKMKYAVFDFQVPANSFVLLCTSLFKLHTAPSE